MRSRLGEYCGGALREPGSLSALSFAAYGGTRGIQEPDGAPSEVPVDSVSRSLEEGADLCRSLADRVGTLLHLDVDYANHDDPAEPYRDPQRTFRRLEPVFAAAREAFETYGVRPLVVMTGRGYHFVAKAVHGTPLHSLLVAIGSPGSALQARYQRLAAATGRPLVQDGRAHDGAGRLLEFLAHEVMRELAGRTEVPVTLLDLAAPAGGPFVCLDLTAYVDPLLSRSVRCPFSSNQKPLMQGLAVEPGYVFMVPRDGEQLGDLLHIRQEVRSAGELAARSDVRIPPALRGARAGSPPTWAVPCTSSTATSIRDRRSTLRSGRPLTTASTWARCPRAPPTRWRSPIPPCSPRRWSYTVALALWAQGWHLAPLPRWSARATSRRTAARDHWERYDPEGRARFSHPRHVRRGGRRAGEPGRLHLRVAARARPVPGRRMRFRPARLWETPRPPWGGCAMRWRSACPWHRLHAPDRRRAAVHRGHGLPHHRGLHRAPSSALRRPGVRGGGRARYPRARATRDSLTRRSGTT